MPPYMTHGKTTLDLSKILSSNYNLVNLTIKALIVYLAYQLHGLPFIGIGTYLIATIIIAFLIFSTLRSKINTSWLAVALGLLCISALLPKLQIKEQQRILVEDRHIIQPQDFMQHADKYGYFLTADGYLQGYQDQRYTNDINIEHGVLALRNFKINQHAYNAYCANNKDIKSSLPLEAICHVKDLPFVLKYNLNPSLIGMQLEYSGLIYLFQDNKYTKLEPGKLIITKNIIDSSIVAFGGTFSNIESSDLKMTLHLNATYTIFNALKFLSLLGGIILLFSTCFKLEFYLYRFELIILSLSFICIAYLDYLNLYYGSLVAGGMDGRAHSGFAASMLQSLADGNILEALQSPEKIFYFMPGFRYVVLLNHLFFGDSYLLLILSIICTPLILFSLIRQYQDSPYIASLIALPVCAIMLRFFKPLLNNVYGEIVAFPLFFIAITMLSKGIKNIRSGFALFALFAIIISMRPDLTVTIIVLTILYVFSTIFSPLRVPQKICTLLGGTPVLLLPLHNILGGKFVPITRAANIDVNLTITFNNYYHYFLSWLHLPHQEQAITQLLQHFTYHSLHTFIFCCTNSALIIVLFFADNLKMRAIAGSCLAGLSIFLFYHIDTRYFLPHVILGIIFVSITIHKLLIRNNTIIRGSQYYAA